MENPRRRFPQPALYVAWWVPLAAIYAIAVWSSGAPLGNAVGAGVFDMVVAALLGVAVFYLLPRTGSKLSRSARHLALALTYAVLWATFALVTVKLSAPEQFFRQFLQRAYVWQLVTGVILYGLLAATFIAYETAERLRWQVALTARTEALRVQAELDALRSRLNPHFLFNTLHSVSALMATDVRAAEDAMERLGSLLRRVLDGSDHRAGHHEIALADELALIRDYVAIERIRHGDRLIYRESIESDALEFSVPALSLQPLVENAIRHGISPRSQPGVVTLAAEVKGDRLEIAVTNDIVERAPVVHAGNGDGVGLGVLRRRLEARFGHEAALAVSRTADQRFVVTLAIPARLPLRELALDE